MPTPDAKKLLTAPVVERLLTIEEMMETLRLKRTKCNQLIGEGRVKSLKIDGSRRIPASAITEFVLEQLNGGCAPKSLEESQRIITESVEAGVITGGPFEATDRCQPCS